MIRAEKATKEKNALTKVVEPRALASVGAASRAPVIGRQWSGTERKRR